MKTLRSRLQIAFFLFTEDEDGSENDNNDDEDETDFQLIEWSDDEEPGME